MTWKIVSVCDLSDVPEAKAILGKAGTLVEVGKDRSRLLQELETCDAYLGGGELLVDKEFLDHALQIKVIGSPATGRDHLALDLIAQRKITLFHIAEEYDLLKGFTATAELSFALLLSLIRKLHPAIQDAKYGIWARDRYVGTQLYGKTFGVLGLGRLGSMSARIAQGFGMQVIACDKKDIVMEGVEHVDFDTLLQISDVLSIHIHLTNENEHFINKEALQKMKEGSIFINTSRGRIIEEIALLDSLQSGHLGGAGLDVIDGEWLSVEELREHPLIRYARDHANLLISPHIGGATRESIIGARVFMAKKIADFIRQNI